MRRCFPLLRRNFGPISYSVVRGQWKTCYLPYVAHFCADRPMHDSPSYLSLISCISLSWALENLAINQRAQQNGSVSLLRLVEVRVLHQLWRLPQGKDVFDYKLVEYSLINFKLVEYSTKCNQLLKELGVNVVLRKLAMAMTPTVVISRRQIEGEEDMWIVKWVFIKDLDSFAFLVEYSEEGIFILDNPLPWEKYVLIQGDKDFRSFRNQKYPWEKCTGWAHRIQKEVGYVVLTSGLILRAPTVLNFTLEPQVVFLSGSTFRPREGPRLWWRRRRRTSGCRRPSWKRPSTTASATPRGSSRTMTRNDREIGERSAQNSIRKWGGHQNLRKRGGKHFEGAPLTVVLHLCFFIMVANWKN